MGRKQFKVVQTPPRESKASAFVSAYNADLTDAVEALVRACAGCRGLIGAAAAAPAMDVEDALDNLQTIAPNFYKQAMGQGE